MTRITGRLVAQGPELPAPAPAAPPPPAPDAVATSDPAAELPPLAGADVLQCPAWLLGTMPVATTLTCTARDGRRFVVTTHRGQYAAALAAKLPVFTGAELGAIAFGAMHERVSAVQLGEWLDMKLATPESRVTVAEAVGAAIVPETAERWTIGRTFARLGVCVEAMNLED